MDLRSLGTFVEAAELGSFTRAGQKLGYSQPTVSFQIKQLEQELGVPLFERIGHTITLTEEGEHALHHAQQILRTCQEMVQGPNQLQQPSGVIRLATADSLCTPLVAHHFADFRRKYPKLSLQVRTAGTSELFQLLDHNEVDVLCTLDRHIFNTSYVTAIEEKAPVHFVSSSEHMLAKQESVSIPQLLCEPCLLTEKDMSYCRMLHERLAQENCELKPVLESGNADLLCQLVEQNLGISFLPDFVTEQSVKAGKMKRLNVPDLDIELWKQVIYRKEKWVSLPLKAVLEHLCSIRLESLAFDLPDTK